MFNSMEEYFANKQRAEKEKKPVVIKYRCPQNHRCPAVMVCPVGAIVQEDSKSAPVIDYDKCINCGKCVRYCGMGAIVFE